MSIPSAIEQAEMIRQGEVSPIELVEETIARIEKLNSAVNAVVVPTFDEALEAANSPIPDGPFRGVPLLLKDLGAVQEGMPLYQGNRVLKELDLRARADTPLGRRFREAGFIVVGKTATPEFGLQPTTQPQAFGPCRNPWDPQRSTAGSSGGAAAAVACGMVSMAHASDGGGSIRNPAAACGVVGLKPSRGRVTRGVLISRLGQELAVSRSVKDTAAMLDAVHGPEPGDLYCAPPPDRPFVEEVGVSPGKLRIGFLTSVDADIRIDDDCVREVVRVAESLESLGHHVEDSHPDRLYDDAFWENAELEYACMVRATIEQLWSSIGRSMNDGDFEPYTWARLERVKDTSAADFIRASSWLQRYTSRISSWWAKGFDVLVTPTSGEPAALLDTLVPDEEDPFAIDERFARVRCFARPFNVTGHPAISLPLGKTKDDLPVGIQLVADQGREDLLIRLASQLEESLPWIERVPKISA